MPMLLERLRLQRDGDIFHGAMQCLADGPEASAKLKA